MTSDIKVFVININNRGAREAAKRRTGYNQNDYYFVVPWEYHAFWDIGNGGYAVFFGRDIMNDENFSNLIPENNSDLIGLGEDDMFENMRKLFSEGVTLVLFFTLRITDQDKVCERMVKFNNQADPAIDLIYTKGSDEVLNSDTEIISFMNELQEISEDIDKTISVEERRGDAGDKFSGTQSYQ